MTGHHSQRDQVVSQFVDAGEIERQGLGDKNRRLLDERGQIHARQRGLTECRHCRLLVGAIEQRHLKGGKRPRGNGTVGGRRMDAARRLNN